MGVQLNEDRFYKVNLTLTPDAVAGTGSATGAVEQEFNCANLRTSDMIFGKFANTYTTQPGLTIGACRCTTAGKVKIAFVNPSSGSITPTAGLGVELFVFRREKSYTDGLPE